MDDIDLPVPERDTSYAEQVFELLREGIIIDNRLMTLEVHEGRLGRLGFEDGKFCVVEVYGPFPVRDDRDDPPMYTGVAGAMAVREGMPNEDEIIRDGR
jgi:hypothetical protein